MYMFGVMPVIKPAYFAIRGQRYHKQRDPYFYQLNAGFFPQAGLKDLHFG